mmetsp:Transcript_2230/g.5627  ORF Transcript_2230/g.5627 Transcript_2230/m.5627 type:complete len:152 (-) Transcript_2230:364-819(-)
MGDYSYYGYGYGYEYCSSSDSEDYGNYGYGYEEDSDALELSRVQKLGAKFGYSQVQLGSCACGGPSQQPSSAHKKRVPTKTKRSSTNKEAHYERSASRLGRRGAFQLHLPQLQQEVWHAAVGDSGLVDGVPRPRALGTRGSAWHTVPSIVR